MLVEGVCVRPDVGSEIEEKVTANPRGGDRLWTGSCELVYVSKAVKKTQIRCGLGWRVDEVDIVKVGAQ